MWLRISAYRNRSSDRRIEFLDTTALQMEMRKVSILAVAYLSFALLGAGKRSRGLHPHHTLQFLPSRLLRWADHFRRWNLNTACEFVKHLPDNVRLR
jgi:hypothetical protein